MNSDNKLSAAWNKFFGMNSKAFYVKPFYECFAAGFDAGLADEWTLNNPRKIQVLEAKLEEALRQRNFYAAFANADSAHIKRFEQLLNDIK